MLTFQAELAYWYFPSSVAHRTCLYWNQCGGSGMFIPDPGSWFLPIPDPGSKNSNKREGWKKNRVITFYVATNFTKLHIILVLMCRRKKFGPIFKELYNFLSKKLSISSLKYGFGIRDPGKTYSGSRIQGSKRHRIPDPDPQHWLEYRNPAIFCSYISMMVWRPANDFCTHGSWNKIYSSKIIGRIFALKKVCWISPHIVNRLNTQLEPK
jgi:hypothetical protein